MRWQDREAARGARRRRSRASRSRPRRPRPAACELVRVPTLWSGPEIEHSPSLASWRRAARAELSPRDAARLGVENGDEVELSVEGERQAIARCAAPCRTGSVFVRGRGSARTARSRSGRRDRSGGRLMPTRHVWVMIAKSILIFVVFLRSCRSSCWASARSSAASSRASAPTGSARGVLQPAADVLKLLSKEAFTPATAVPWMMAIAPVISVVTAVATMAIIPFGPVGAWGGDFGLYGIDVSIGVLYFFAFGSLAFYGLMLGGWSSGSKYSFLGAMRAAAQLISYEVALGLSLLGVAMTAGSMSLVDIVEHAGRHVVHRAAVRRLLHLPGGRLRRRPRARRSTCPRATPRSSAATTPSSAGCASARSSWPSTWRSSMISAIAATCFLGGWHGPGPIALARCGC